VFGFGILAGEGDDHVEVGSVKATSIRAYFGSALAGGQGDDELDMGSRDIRGNDDAAVFDNRMDGDEGNDNMKMGNLEVIGATAYIGSTILSDQSFGEQGDDTIAEGEKVIRDVVALFDGGLISGGGDDEITTGDIKYTAGQPDSAFFGSQYDGGPGDDVINIGNRIVKNFDEVFDASVVGGFGDDEITVGNVRTVGTDGSDAVLGFVLAGDTRVEGDFAANGDDRLTIGSVLIAGKDGDDSLTSAEIKGIETLRGKAHVVKGGNGNDEISCLEGDEITANGGKGIDTTIGPCDRVVSVP
jgi:hypothetical protein